MAIGLGSSSAAARGWIPASVKCCRWLAFCHDANVAAP